MDLKPVDLSEPTTTEHVSFEVTKEIVNPLTQEVEMLTKQNIELLKEIDELKAINRIEAALLQVKPTVDEATLQKMEELEKRLGQTLFELDCKTKDYDRDISARDQLNQDLLVKLNDLKAREPGYIAKIEELTHDKDTFLFKFEATKKERDTVLFERDNLLRGVQDLKSQLSELRAAYEKVLPELVQSKTLVTNLENEVKRISDLLFLQQQENAALLLRVSELEFIRSDYESIKKLLGEMTLERDQLLRVLNAKECEVLSLRSEVSKYASDLQVKKDVIGHIVQAEEVLASDVNELQGEVNQRDKIIEDLVFKQNELKTNELKLMETIDTLRREKESILPELEVLRAENQRLRADLARVVPERDNLRAMLEQKEHEIISLKNEVEKLGKENLNLIASMAELEMKRNSALELLRQREAEIQHLKEEMEKLRTDLAYFKDKAQFLEIENGKLVDLNKEQEKEILAMKLKIQRIPELENKIKELEVLNEQLRGQIASLESVKMELIQARKDYETIMMERDCLLATLRDKETEISRLSGLLVDYGLVKERLIASEAELKRLTALHIAEDARIKELEIMVTNLQFSVKNEKELAEQNEKLLQANTMLSKKVQELEYSYTTLSTKYHKMESIYAQIKGVAENLGDVHDKLIETCEETERVEAKLKDTEIKQGHFIEQEKKTNLHNLSLD